MRRNGFTMVELIFVIIIIGILSVAAIPKFGDIKDRAKINSEYSALGGLESAITAKMEFTMEDQDNIKIDWNNVTFDTSAEKTAGLANTNKKVLSAIAKKSDSLRISKILKIKADGSAGDDTAPDQYYDVFFLEGAASNSITGVVKEDDTQGRPDKNDVWVFNASPVDVTIKFWDSHLTTPAAADKVLHSGDMALIDIAGVDAIKYGTGPATGEKTGVEVFIGSDSSGTATAVTALP